MVSTISPTGGLQAVLADVVAQVQGMDGMPVIARWETCQAADGRPWLVGCWPAGSQREVLAGMRALERLHGRRAFQLAFTSAGVSLDFVAGGVWVSLLAAGVGVAAPYCDPEPEPVRGA